MLDVRTNEPRAIQRTAITEAGEKIGRMMLGPKTSAAIKLSADEDVTIGLAVGEGLETAGLRDNNVCSGGRPVAIVRTRAMTSAARRASLTMHSVNSRTSARFGWE